MKRTAARKRVTMTAEQLKAWRAKVAAVEAEKDDLIRRSNELRADADRQQAELAASLRQTREAVGMTLDQLSDRSGIGQAQLSRLLSGRVPNPTIQTLNRVAAALNARVKITIES